MHCLSFMHRASALGTTAPRTGSAAKGRRVRRVDDVYDDAARFEAIRIYGQGIVGVHTQRRGIDHDLATVWIGCAKMCSAPGFGSNALGEVFSSTLVDIEYGQRPGTRRRDRKCDGSARATGADEKNGFVGRVITFPLHSEHATEAIEHGTDPASIAMATDDVECADLTSSWMKLVDKSQHPLLMRHRDQYAGQISHRPCTGHECGQVIRLDSKWNANRVRALLDEEPVQ